MNLVLFLLSLSISLILIYTWAFKNLPNKNWQFIAAIPKHHYIDSEPNAYSLTWYGFFYSLSVVTGASLYLLMMASCQLTLFSSLLAIILILGIAVLFSKVSVRWIEGTWKGQSIAGGAFFAFITSPLIAWGIQRTLDPQFSILIFCSAIGVSYLFGEGLGRLACLSYGCCYGRRIDQCPSYIQRLFKPFSITYEGSCKKACYAGQLEGIPLLPIQAITTTALSCAGLFALVLFYLGYFKTAFLFSLIFSQSWRIYSERWREDYRGENSFSLYQWMGIANILVALIITFYSKPFNLTVVFNEGLKAFQNFWLLGLLQLLFLLLFSFTGISQLTASQTTFLVKPNK